MKTTLRISVFVLFSVLAFSASTAFAAGPAIIDLGTASNFVVLTRTGITNVPASNITGNIGTSLDQASTDTAFAGITCGEVTGLIYSFNSTGPLPCVLADSVLSTTVVSTAVGDMMTSYTNASAPATPAGVGANLNVNSGTLNGQNFTPGTYTWDTPGSVSITGDITLTGSATDVWIFQVNGTLDIASGMKINLSGGALPQNIFWQVTGAVTLITGATFEGNILAQTNIAMQSGATLHGRALAQTAVTLISNTISAAAPLSSTKDITSLAFGASTGVITGNNISVIVPSGTNLTALTPTIGITGASVNPLSGTAQNFTSPATYTVTAENASTKVYTVTVGTYYNDIIKVAERLVALQNANGSWDWVVTNQAGPSATTYYNITGVTAQALLDAYALNNDQTYLDAAKRAGDFIVGIATSTSQSQNAFNVVFLQDLATASASSTYETKANDILNNIFSEDNKWAHTSGSNCTVAGCTADQLVASVR